MNDYCKRIIIEEQAKQIEETIHEYADSFSDDITAKNLKELLFGSSYLKQQIIKVLELFNK